MSTRDPHNSNLGPLVDALVNQIPDDEGSFLADKVQLVVVKSGDEPHPAYDSAKYARNTPGSKWARHVGWVDSTAEFRVPAPAGAPGPEL